jgi:hypothetical protein
MNSFPVRFGFTAGLLLAGAAFAAFAAPPSFRDTAAPAGWSVAKGEARDGRELAAKGPAPLELATSAPVETPATLTLRFRAGAKGAVTLAAEAEGAAAPLLEGAFTSGEANEATFVAKSDGKPMAADAASDRSWPTENQPSGLLKYGWRFARVKNLWDERDRLEIGSAFAGLVPFREKVFAMRVVLAPSGRQVWLDDRLVAEQRAPVAGPVRFRLKLGGEAAALGAEFGVPPAAGPFAPLALGSYSHARKAAAAEPGDRLVELAEAGGQKVPMRVPSGAQPDLDLGESLFRYRLTHGSGPEAGYVCSRLGTWPHAFRVDPATFVFRVPWRHYQVVWLLAWLDRRSDAVPRGTFRFFRYNAGYPASTDFEITPEAVRSGRVTRLPGGTLAGKEAWLVRVPVETDGFYGLRDMEGQFLEFELSKPVALMRSHPDPIYYGHHPAGPPSSVHVAGITLETAPFGYEVRPSELGFVFEQPGKPACAVAVTNLTARPLEARVTLSSRSHDGSEEAEREAQVRVAPGASAEAALEFGGLKRLGWHALGVRVEAEGVSRENALSFVLLPPNPRTYGYAANETRFGIWSLAGHYTSMRKDWPGNPEWLSLARKLGLRRIPFSPGFADADVAKKHELLPTGSHTTMAKYWVDQKNPQAMKELVEGELKLAGEHHDTFADVSYFYGGEWQVSKEDSYSPLPRYTGEGERELTPEQIKELDRQWPIFLPVGKAIREKFPKTKLFLQWGAPQATVAFLRHGFPKELVDGFGMDAPMFELLPETSNMTGSVHTLWALRQEAKRLGWPRLPIRWCEGPFFPTNPGALTEDEQAEYQVRYPLLAMAYGVDQFESGIVVQDAGNYYGAEHYGAGIFHRRPLENPKPAVAAVATMTRMLCGADYAGPLDTGSLTAFGMVFQRAGSREKTVALWRVSGRSEARLRVIGARPTLTDAMGNAEALAVEDGWVRVAISPSPAWLTGVEQVAECRVSPPTFDPPSAKVVRPLAKLAADRWSWDGSEDKAYSGNHFAVKRVADPNLRAEFGRGEPGHEDAVGITLAEEPGDRPLANRYGALKAKRPVEIPGKAAALGVWVKGNGSWGRVVYQLRDAKGEAWTSFGTKDDWNCDDPHGWSYVHFEGWRYVRFPLPGNHPWDASREAETTWWGSRDAEPSTDSTSSRPAGPGSSRAPSNGDGVVDLPLSIEKIFVEARNEVPYLGEMKHVPERVWKLAGLVAEYEDEEAASGAAVRQNRLRAPAPEWSGPAENVLARLAADGVGEAPAIREFSEPHQWRDGRQMVVRFEEAPGTRYRLYLSRYPDGRGAELFADHVKDGQTVAGFRPEIPVHLFLTATGADQKESRPSKGFPLITHDHFAEK